MCIRVAYYAHAKRFRHALTLGTVLLAFLTLARQAAAQYSLGDAVNYAILYNGAGTTGHNTVDLGGGGAAATTIYGEVGVDNTSTSTTSTVSFQGSAGNGYTTVNGNINFDGTSAHSTVSHVGTGGTYSPNSINYSDATVASDMSALSTLSTTAAGYTGTSVAIQGSTGTLNVTGGTRQGTSNLYVYKVTSIAGGLYTLTINGTANEQVIFNFSGSQNIGATIDLTGGITPDDVLFNVTGTNTLTINTNGTTESAVYLDPTGTITVTDSVIDGGVFGGGGGTLSISTSTINDPVPEPRDYAFWLLVFCCLLMASRRLRPLLFSRMRGVTILR